MIPNLKNNMQNPERGFTLVELAVVLAIFFIIISAVITVFITAIQQQKRLLDQQDLLNQVSYVTDFVSASLKAAVPDTNGSCIGAGNIYQLTNCPNGTLVPCNGIKFINQFDGGACESIFLDK